MQCHACLRMSAQATYKGSTYCIRCLWGLFPELKAQKQRIDKCNNDYSLVVQSNPEPKPIVKSKKEK